MFEQDDAGFHAFRAAHQSQYGVAIAFIKDKVGQGTEYVNEVARAVLSDEGGYFQLTELPEEFVGAVGDGVAHRLIAVREAQNILSQLETLMQSVRKGRRGIRALSLYALYPGASPRTRQAMFVFDQQANQPAFTHGVWQPDVLPRFFKVKVDASDEAALPPALGLRNGILFFLAPGQRDDGRCLLVTFHRTPGTQDLSVFPLSSTMN